MPQPKQLKRLRRTIVIGDETWTYQIGHHYAVVMNPQRDKKTIVHLSEMGGGPVGEWYTEQLPVTPALVERWIRRHRSDKNA